MTPAPDAFYLPVGPGEEPGSELFESTTATESPWDPTAQHGGPPAGLLVRAIERSRSDETMPIGRVTVDMLGGIPQGRIRTQATITRPGRRVERVEASLWANDRLAVTATAWRLRATPDSTRQHASPTPPPPPLPGPERAATRFFPGVRPEWGYGHAVEWRFVEGGFEVLGPARVWARLRLPLVAGEDTSPTSRLLVVADSANGLSGSLPFADWLFIPPTVTATVQRPPSGEWMYVDAATTIGPHGTGLARATMHDEQGLLAEVAQPLLVAPKG